MAAPPCNPLPWADFLPFVSIAAVRGYESRPGNKNHHRRFHHHWNHQEKPRKPIKNHQENPRNDYFNLKLTLSHSATKRQLLDDDVEKELLEELAKRWRCELERPKDWELICCFFFVFFWGTIVLLFVLVYRWIILQILKDYWERPEGLTWKVWQGATVVVFWASRSLDV